MEKEVRNFIQKTAKQKGIEVSCNTDLFSSGVFDSLEIVSFLTYLETELNVSFATDDLYFENFQTINSILNWISKSCSEKDDLKRKE